MEEFSGKVGNIIIKFAFQNDHSENYSVEQIDRRPEKSLLFSFVTQQHLLSTHCKL